MMYQESGSLNQTQHLIARTICKSSCLSRRVYCETHHSSQGHSYKRIYDGEASKVEEGNVFLWGWRRLLEWRADMGGLGNEWDLGS